MSDAGASGAVGRPLLPALGAISRGLNEAIGRSSLLDPDLRDLLVRIGNALDDVLNGLDDDDHL